MSFVTSSLVLNEVAGLLQRKHLSAALAFMQEVRANPDLDITYADATLQAEAWDLFNRWGGSGAIPLR